MIQLVMLPFRLNPIFLFVVAIGIYLGAQQLEKREATRSDALATLMEAPPPAQVAISAFDARNSTERNQEVNLTAAWAYAHNTQFFTTKDGKDTEEGVMLVLLDDNAEGEPTARAVVMAGAGRGKALTDWMSERVNGFTARPDTMRVRVEGLVSRPILRSRVEDALAEAGLTRAPGFFYITPFLDGREATIQRAAERSGGGASGLLTGLALVLGAIGLMRLLARYGGGGQVGSLFGARDKPAPSGEKPAKSAFAAPAAAKSRRSAASSDPFARLREQRIESTATATPAQPQAEKAGAPWSTTALPEGRPVEEPVMRPISNSSSQDFIANIRVRDSARVSESAQIPQPLPNSGSAAWSAAAGGARIAPGQTGRGRAPVVSRQGGAVGTVLSVIGLVFLMLIALAWYSINQQGGFDAMLDRATRDSNEVEMVPITPSPAQERPANPPTSPPANPTADRPAVPPAEQTINQPPIPPANPAGGPARATP